ncbi:MAG: PilZ domain-containing protein [Candidatus Omnitrophica bacterium]|nr:PilZ domain-containing protein [Candidatus Omnitrophota bacterium]
MDKERRRSKRAVVSIAAKCREIERANYHDVRIKDMHPEGFCFRSDHRFAQGQKLMFGFDLPLHGMVYLTANVAWSKAIPRTGIYMAGVSFLIDDPVTREARSHIYNFFQGRNTQDFR